MLARRLLPFASAVLLSLTAACADEPAEEAADDDAAALAKCGDKRNELVVWAPSGGHTEMLDGLAKDTACTDYYVVMPLKIGDKTELHADIANQLARLRARGKNFHAVAEFHWSSWRKWVDAAPGRTWEGAGREMRRRMDAAGFVVGAGATDSWFIQEVPSTVVLGNDEVSAALVRTNVSGAAKGLFEGGKFSGKMGGAMRVGAGHDVTEAEEPSVAVGKSRLKAFLQDDKFWDAMNRTMRWWSDEVYVEPVHACVTDAQIGAQAKSINAYAFRIVSLADAGGAATKSARTFLRRTYTPLLNGTFGLPRDSGYGETRVPLATMESFLPLEIYAASAYAQSRDMGGTRLGFAWLPGQDADARARMGAATAKSLNRTFDRGAGFACSPTGTFQACGCAVSGATLEGVWATYETW